MTTLRNNDCGAVFVSQGETGRGIELVVMAKVPDPDAVIGGITVISVRRFPCSYPLSWAWEWAMRRRAAFLAAPRT